MNAFQAAPRRTRAIVLKVALTIIVTASALRMPAQVEYVDPTIGNVGILLVPTRPTVYMPNSMIRVYPIRADAMDDRIESFPLTINSHRMDELFSLMPGEDGKAAAWDEETTTPYYYSVYLGDSRIQTEFSATERCGYFRMTFPSGHASVMLANRLNGELHVDRGAVIGEERFNDMAAYVYGEFREPVQSKVETARDKSRLIARSPSSKVLEFRYGISFISVEQAKKNLARRFRRGGLNASEMKERKSGTRRSARSRLKAAMRRSAKFSTPRFIVVSNEW
jgi:putative alpha-1,2-mannosidase